MRVIEVRPLLDTIFNQEPELPSRVDSVEQVRWDHCDVYRVSADGLQYMVHVTAEARGQLVTARQNLERLAPIAEERIPRAVAWRDSGDAAPGSEWAILVSTRVLGTELTGRKFSWVLWCDLKELLSRIHRMPAESVDADVISLPVHQPAAFAGVAEAVQALVGLLRVPLSRERVRRHLDAMSEYLHEHTASFRVPTRFIHGDLNPSNIVADGSRAGIVDWAEFGHGDYAYDLATLKFSLDSIVPQMSSGLLREQVIEYRSHFEDDSLETRLRFFLALPGLVAALSFPSYRSPSRAWRVRTCFLHSEAQWREPLRLSGPYIGAPAAPTAHSPLAVSNPFRGLAHVLGARWTT